MNENEQLHSAPSSARRKLLRGTFSVPAVLAVHNGSALAAASNNKACAIRSIASDPATPPQPISGSGTDGWSRASYYLDANSTPRKWVRYSDLQTLANAKGVGLVIPSTVNSSGVQTGFIRVKTGGLYEFGTPTGSVSNTPAGSVALLFDNAGAGPTIRITGFVQQGAASFTTGTGVVTTSCWSSLKP